MNILARILAALTGGAIAATAAEPLREGAKLPDVTQRNHEGVPVRLRETGEGFLLVYFYPKADTPGCTKQACSLRDSFSDLSDRRVRVIGVSSDTPAAQKAFREKFRLPFDLLADEDGSVAAAFGVPRLMGFPKRQAFLFRDGVLVWRDLSASTAEQAADVLSFLKKSGDPATPGD